MSSYYYLASISSLSRLFNSDSSFSIFSIAIYLYRESKGEDGEQNLVFLSSAVLSCLSMSYGFSGNIISPGDGTDETRLAMLQTNKKTVFLSTMVSVVWFMLACASFGIDDLAASKLGAALYGVQAIQLHTNQLVVPVLFGYLLRDQMHLATASMIEEVEKALRVTIGTFRDALSEEVRKGMKAQEVAMSES